MDSVVERIVQRRAVLAEQAERLRKELSEVEAELERIQVAEGVVAELMAEPAVPAGTLPSWEASPPVGMVPHRTDGLDVTGLPEAYQQIMAIAEAHDGPVACKTVCERLGLALEPRFIETTRSKLKRLVARGWLVEPSAGRFAIAS